MKGHRLDVDFVWSDLGDSTQLNIAWNWAMRRGPVHILINNAAVAQRQAFTDMSAAAYEETIRVNLMAPVRLSKLFVDSVKDQREFTGCIVNIISIAGMQGMTAMFNSEYSASKAAMSSFADSLR